MVLAVVLQIIGAAVFVAACGLLFGSRIGLAVLGVVLFAAGLAHERSVGRS